MEDKLFKYGYMISTFLFLALLSYALLTPNVWTLGDPCSECMRGGYVCTPLYENMAHSGQRNLSSINKTWRLFNEIN